MNGLADPLALLLGVGHPGELAEEPLPRLDVDQRDVEVLAEGLHDLLGLALAEQAVVDEDAGQLLADRAVHEQGRDGRVDAAGQPADDPLVAHLGADPIDLLLDDLQRRPGGRRADGPEQEVLQELGAARGVLHLGVELDAVEPALGALHRGHRRRRRRRGHPESRRGVGHRVEVAHPAAGRVGQVVEQLAAEVAQLGLAVLPPARAGDRAAEGHGHGLHPVADAEHRDPELEHRRVERRRAGLVHRRRAAGQDQGLRVAPAELLDRRVVRQELGEHPALAYPPGDQLRVLGPEVEDDHRAVGGGRRRPPCRLDLCAALAHADIVPVTPVVGHAMVAPSW